MSETMLGLDRANRQSPSTGMSLGSNSCSFRGFGFAGETAKIEGEKKEPFCFASIEEVPASAVNREMKKL